MPASTVVVTSCRGYRGRVVSATDTDVRIELEAQYKTVTVKKEQLKGQEGTAAPSGGYPGAARAPAPWQGGNRSSSNAQRTPMHAGSATPMHPSATPMHPSATPMHPGKLLTSCAAPPTSTV